MSLKSSNNVETNVYALEIVISAEDFDAAQNKVFAKQKNKIQLPGFRKGKVTRKMAENFYGKGWLYEDALDLLFADAVEGAAKEAELEIVGTKSADVKEIGANGVEMTVEIFVKPEIELTQYTELKATKKKVEATAEEVEAKKMSLSSIIDYMTDIIVKRANVGKNFGIAVIPEGLIEFIPEMKVMIAGLNDLMAHLESDDSYQNATQAEKYEIITSKLDSTSAKLFNSLPSTIKAQLLMDRDPHGNVQVSKIETEKLLIEMIATKLKEMKAQGSYKGKFADQAHFFGYEGRCAMPSNFDADYCYSLGYNAFALIQSGLTGYLSSIKNTTKPASEWVAGGVPLTMMMNMERRHGAMKPVIKKALVELDGPVFKALEANRAKWATNDCYVFPGAVQYFGPAAVCDVTTITLQLEQEKSLVNV